MLSFVEKNLKALPDFNLIVVGVSGGSDSMALMHMLHELGQKMVVAHINHGIRGEEADRDEAFVKAAAEKLGLPFYRTQLNLPKGNMEAQARKARYAYFEKLRKETGADAIAVAHHQGDQVETILMHKERGAGLRGLRGMQYQSGYIIRPMLNLNKEDICTYLEEKGIKFVHDSSNDDLTLKRNQIRAEIKEKNPRNILIEAEEASRKLKELSAKAAAWMQQHYADNRFERTAFNSLDKDVKAEVLIQLLGQEDLYSRHIHLLVAHIEKGESGKTLSFKGKSLIIEYDFISVQPESPEKIELKKELIQKSGTTWGKYTVKSVSKVKLYVRSWKAGDKFKPSGMQGTKKLQDFFVDAKVPKLERCKIPIIVDENDHIVAVGDMRFDERFLELKEQLEIK